jgi:hypothetical protein
MKKLISLIVAIFVLQINSSFARNEKHGIPDEGTLLDEIIASRMNHVKNNAWRLKIACPTGYQQLRDQALDALNNHDLYTLQTKLSRMQSYSENRPSEIKEEYPLCFNPQSIHFWKFDIIWLGLRAVERGLIEELIQKSLKLKNYDDSSFAMRFLKYIQKLNNDLELSGIEDKLNKNIDSLLSSAYDSFEPNSVTF